MLWFIDNLGVVSVLCKGSSVVYDFGCVVHVLHIMCAMRKLAANWWEHVDSKANVSDWGTRDAVPLYASAGIAMRPAPVPQWPHLFLISRLATGFLGCRSKCWGLMVLNLVPVYTNWVQW